jgi:hypothetical protein
MISKTALLLTSPPKEQPNKAKIKIPSLTKNSKIMLEMQFMKLTLKEIKMKAQTFMLLEKN